MPLGSLERARRWSKPVAFALSGVILLAGVSVTVLTIDTVGAAGRLGADLTLYLGATRDALAGEGFYPAHQVAGPYALADGNILYPPPALLLFIPFLILPAALFWLIPIALVSVVVLHHRPRPWTWPLMALALAYPITSLKIVHGNPVMWIAAAAALGTVLAWPSVFVLLKPSLAPFALIGAARRSWWIALGAAAVASLAFGDMWGDYVAVALNARSPNGILYSLDEAPLMLIPVIAWLGRSRRATEAQTGPAEV